MTPFLARSRRTQLTLSLIVLLPGLLSIPAAACPPAAGGSPGTCDGGPAVQGNTSGIQVGAGNPLNVITGNKYQREVDMPALPGVLGLEIVRHYNSAYSGPNEGHGLIGRGWKLSYETVLQAIGATLQIIEADGTRLIFDRDAHDPGRCHGANPAAGSLQIERKPGGSEEFTWTWVDGRKLHFDANGKLVSILAPGGQFVSLIYDSHGVLVKVIDPQGRSLALSYLSAKTANRSGRFAGVQAIDSPLGRFRFDYGSPVPKGHRLPDPRILWATLVRVSSPGSSRAYHYESSQFPTLLTGISVGGSAGKSVTQRYTTFGYDASGRAVLSTHAFDVGKVSLEHGDGKSGGNTVLTNSLGQSTLYRHTVIAGQYRLLDVRGAGCSTCGEANVRYGYDRLARLTSVIRLTTDGQPWQTTRTELDNVGRTLKVFRMSHRHGQPGPPQLLMRHEYAGGSWQPSLIARPSVVPGREAITRIAYNDKGQVLTVTDSGWAPAIDAKFAPAPIQRTTSYRYRTISGRSLLFEIDGPLKNGKSNGPRDSDVTRIDWDRGGNRVVTITVPGNVTSSAQYDDAGRISALISADGHQTGLRYNAQQQLIAAISSGITQSAQYDTQGNLVEIGHGEGEAYQASAHLGADATGSRWIASHPGIVTRQRHDTEGRLFETSTASASFMQTQRYVYDELGRLITATDAAGGTRRIRYNPQSLPGVVQDALGREAHLDYDGEGNLIQLTAPMPTQGQRNVTRFEYDALGQVAVVVAPNGAITRTIGDDFGRTIAIVSPDSGTDSRSHDAAGRIIASLDARGNRARYEYDVAGRIAQQTVIDANAADPAKKFSVTAWKYHGARLIAIDHPQQGERYRYDQQRRLSARTVILNPVGGAQVISVARYRYDTLGQIVSTSLPDGSSIDLRRNGQNQVVALERSRIQTPWLKWLLPAQAMVHHLERDIAGLRSATYGNGMQAYFLRSREGILERIVHRAAGASAVPQQFDHRYQWDQEGNLLHVASKDGKRLTSSHHAYDEQDRLIATSSQDSQDNNGRDSNGRDSSGNSAAPPLASYSRYFYDGAGNRMLAQEDIADQADIATHTVKADYAAASNRWQGLGSEKGGSVIYDASGQPVKIGSRHYLWNALGQLVEVRQDQRSLASYRYNHQGQRICKTTRESQTYYLYDGQHLVAELNGQGQITRQYVYLGDQAIAVIDSLGGKKPVDHERNPLEQIAADFGAIFDSWFSGKDAIAYLHNNHLGATELVTDGKGEAIWQASYSPYGKIVQTVAKAGFKFNLRLPGQYQDDETGLHYNHHRYYDPARGQYLTPDPLGLRGGINTYAYAASNPLKYMDPSGLILFAFDGTGNNSEPNSKNIDSTNVALMHEFYDDTVTGQEYKRYKNGIGSNPNSWTTTTWAQQGLGLGAKGKINEQLYDFLDYINQLSIKKIKNERIMIDVIGFSRGAAQARDFSNTLLRNYNSGMYGKACLEFRFMGLYDTVAQFGSNGSNDEDFDMTIAPEWKSVAQAYALNEHRPLFPLQSIQGSGGGTRIEQGFIGAHADIGGGYNDTKERYKGDLSDVALMWMVQQAEAAGVKFSHIDDEFKQVTRPIVHEQRNNGGAKLPTSPGGLDFGYRYRHGVSSQINHETGEITENFEPAADREVRFSNGGMTTSSDVFASKAGELEAMIKRAPNWEKRTEQFGYADNCVGAVDMKKYREWLQKNLNLRILPAVNEGSSSICKME
jgi:RHS repeat-associated protein